MEVTTQTQKQHKNLYIDPTVLSTLFDSLLNCILTLADFYVAYKVIKMRESPQALLPSIFVSYKSLNLFNCTVTGMSWKQGFSAYG